MKIKETIDFEYITTLGIFKKIENLGTFDWLDDEMSDNLNYNYYLENGERTISVLYKKMMDLQGSPLERLAQIISLKYKDKWNKLYSAYINSTYNPIHNYDMNEEEKVASKVVSRSNSEDGTYGFNSEESVPSSNNESSSEVRGEADDNYRLLSRNGNIGVTTSQKMLRDEIELRKFNFYNEMIKDVNSVLTLSIYD